MQITITEKIQYLSDAQGTPIGVFVPIDVWRQLQETTQAKPRLPEDKSLSSRPALTEEEARLQERFDAVFATQDNRLDSLTSELQAQTLPEGPW